MRDSALAQLVKLQDLDNMIRDAGGLEAELGFKVQNVEKIRGAREKLAGEIPPRWLKLYERLRERYGRAVVPVEDRMCMGCFNTMPTGALPPDSPHQDPQLCESCGRMLYW